MSFLVTEGNIRIIVGDEMRPFLSEGKGGGSALQNPEMSRLQLASMLRRAGSAGKGNGWAAVLAGQTGGCANGNQRA